MLGKPGSSTVAKPQVKDVPAKAKADTKEETKKLDLKADLKHKKSDDGKSAEQSPKVGGRTSPKDGSIPRVKETLTKEKKLEPVKEASIEPEASIEAKSKVPPTATSAKAASNTTKPDQNGTKKQLEDKKTPAKAQQSAEKSEAQKKEDFKKDLEAKLVKGPQLPSQQ